MNIKINLSNLDIAIKAVEDYKKTLPKKVTEIIRRLVAEGQNIAKSQVIDLGAFDTFQLANSINGMVYAKDNRGIIFTDCPYAAYVEFGTGVVGKDNPHPKYPWVYDLNNHGKAGWFYPTDEADPNPNKHEYNGQWYAWTKGMPSRPFMYLTSNELREKLQSIVREVFND